MEGPRVEEVMKEIAIARFHWPLTRLRYPGFFKRALIGLKITFGADYFVMPLRPEDSNTLRDTFEGKDIEIYVSLQEL